MERATRNRPAEAGLVVIDPELCKGCSLCVSACPVKVLRLGGGLNCHGYHPAEYVGSGCTGCGICFYACPEPGAITVYVRARARPSCSGEDMGTNTKHEHEARNGTEA